MVKCEIARDVLFYSFTSDNFMTLQEDLRHVDEWQVYLSKNKVEVTAKFMLQIRSADDKAVTIDVCRTDNRSIEYEEDPDDPTANRPFKRYTSDTLWWNIYGGWSDGLQLILRSNDGGDEHCLSVPANPSLMDCVRIKSSSPVLRILKKIPRDGGSEFAIPRQIFQASRTSLMPCLEKSVSTLRSLNPHWRHTLLIDDQGGLQEKERMIRELEGSRAARAFAKIIPGALKADLWRYVIMYHYGGVYADDKLTLLYPLESFLKPGMRALLVFDTPGNGIYNAFIAIVPKHPLMRMAIDRSIENIEKSHYGENPLEITGPILLGDCFKECQSSRCRQNVHFWFFTKPGEFIVERMSVARTNDNRSWKKQVVRILAHNVEYRRRVSGPKFSDYYSLMWKDRKIYHEGMAGMGSRDELLASCLVGLVAILALLWTLRVLSHQKRTAHC